MNRATFVEVREHFSMWPAHPTAGRKNASGSSIARIDIDIHIRMATPKPHFFDVAVGGSLTFYIDMMSVHLRKVFWHEIDSTFIKGKCMSEMTRVCYRCGSGNVDILLDDTQRRYRIPGHSQLRVLRRA